MRLPSPGTQPAPVGLAQVTVPREVALRLARSCTPAMDGHRWATANITTARNVLASSPEGNRVAAALARLLCHPGWAVVQLPAAFSDEELRLAGAGMLAAAGRPFFSVDDGGKLWIGAESAPSKDPASFGGAGRQGLHIDAPNVEHVPDFTCLLMLRSDPAGGGQSLVADVHAALAELSGTDRAELSEDAYFEGRAEGLHGTGAPRMPFPVRDATGPGRPWVRWSAKMLDDPRNSGRAGVLRRFASALDGHSRTVTLTRGAMLIADQQRTAHGRAALGDQAGLPDGTRRLIIQAKAARDASAPAQAIAPAGAGHE
jgi:Taurine catabolism dioxygenase TauD, TfdA family